MMVQRMSQKLKRNYYVISLTKAEHLHLEFKAFWEEKTCCIRILCKDWGNDRMVMQNEAPEVPDLILTTSINQSWAVIWVCMCVCVYVCLYKIVFMY